MKIANVDFHNDKFVVTCPFFDNERAKSIPDRRWDKNAKCWHAPISNSNVRYLSSEYGEEEFTATALRKIGEFRDKAKKLKQEYFPGWYDFKNKPMAHQKEGLNRAWGKDNYAFFHEMGCGKTFTAISLMSAYAMEGKIAAMVVICPTAIKHIWPWELEKHSPIPFDAYVMQPGARGYSQWMTRESDGLKVLVLGVEALSQGSAAGKAVEFLGKYRCGIVLDESSKIKNHKSNRTKAAITLGELAKVRVMLTGTPISQGIHDLYGQFRFLDWDILGHKSYYSFQARYCVMGGYEGRQIVGYRNIPELLGLVAPYAHTVTKDEALDLPPKVFETRRIPATKQQKDAMKMLKDEMYAEQSGKTIEVKNALDRLTRVSQICGGMFPYNVLEGDEIVTRTEPIPGVNPKLEELASVIMDLPDTASVIIWARFVPEIDMIWERLETLFPGQAVRYYGATSDEERKESILGFQNGVYRFFISNQATGGMGLTLTRATYVVYFSNTYSYQDRVQSEDRAHRKGQENKVTYIDLVLDVPAERAVTEALHNKEDVAVMVRNSLKNGEFEELL